MNKIKVNLEDIKLTGNVIDITNNNYGITYDIYKNNNKQYDIEYIINKNNFELLRNNKYDICVMFFTLKKIYSNYNKKNIINMIYNILKEKGELYIWDINKKPFTTFNNKIDVVLSKNSIKTINVKSYNFFSSNSNEKIIKLMGTKFNIIENRCNNNIFFIKAEKRSLKNESIIRSY